MMRKDIKERMKFLKKEGIKPNYSRIAKRYNCDYRTVKKYYEDIPEKKKAIKKRPSKLDGYKDIIIEKLEYDASITSIFHYIKKLGYQGQYTILREYCKTIRYERQKKATIRFETNPGLQAQVDWKERMRLISKHGEIFEIDLFLIV